MKEKGKKKLSTKGVVTTGFVKLNNELRVEISQKCGAYGLAVYVALLSHHNYTTDQCFPSMETLANESGISKRKISDVLNDLLDYGFIIVRSGGTHHSNAYWFPKEEWFVSTGETSEAYRRKNVNAQKKKEEEEKEYYYNSVPCNDEYEIEIDW